MSINVMSCSYGKDSVASVILAREHGIRIDYILYSEVMYDLKKGISGEVPEHVDFINHVAIPQFEKWGYRCVRVRADTDYKDNFHHVITRSKVPERNGKCRGFPLVGKCAVNKDCKMLPIRRWYKGNHLNHVTQYIGIAIDEPRRLKKLEGTNKISLLEQFHYTEKQAADLCKQYGLCSPIYEFTNRSGCFFCPNTNDSGFRHLREHHQELWHDFVALGDVKNTVSNRFNFKGSIQDMEKRFAQERSKNDYRNK